MTRVETWVSASDGLRRQGRTTRPYGAIPPNPGTDIVHPGAVYTSTQLNYVKGQLNASAEPHTSALATMQSKKAVAGNNSTYAGAAGTAYADATWVAHPHNYIHRLSGAEVPNDYDCVDDGKAALANALVWALTGNRANGNAAIRILNAWCDPSTGILGFVQDAQSTGGKLVCGWTGTTFARAAEIMRYTFTPQSGETALDVTNLKRVFLNVWWPMLYAAHSGPAVNWYMAFADSMMQIGVFLDDRSKINTAAQYLRQTLPGVAYLTGDNNPYSWAHPAGGTLTYSNGDVLSCPNGLPIVAQSVFLPDHNIYDKTGINPATFMDTSQAWFHPLSLPNGLWGEVGRDFHHSGMGFAALGNALETAYKQGVDLYTEFQARLVPAIELFCSFVYQTFVSPVTNTPTNWPFSKASSSSSAASNTQRATMEMLWHHYIGRKGLSMPNLDAYVQNYARPSTYTVDLMIMAEKLTFYGTA